MSANEKRKICLFMIEIFEYNGNAKGTTKLNYSFREIKCSV